MLFKYLVSTEPLLDRKDIDPFKPWKSYTLWQRICRKIYTSPIYLQRYTDHLHLGAYREVLPKFRGKVIECGCDNCPYRK